MREGELKRKTLETDISMYMNLDGGGKCKADSGIGFFDHMLELFACHSGFEFAAEIKGDLKVDFHHTVEDTGITMGQLFERLLGDKKGIQRYSAFYVPMDESLVRVVIDISGRPYLSFDGELSGKVGDFDCELVKEFFYAFAVNAKVTLHIDILRGGNKHHVIEAIFKAFAHSLKQAVQVISDKIPSSKGAL